MSRRKASSEEDEPSFELSSGEEFEEASRTSASSSGSEDEAQREWVSWCHFSSRRCPRPQLLPGALSCNPPSFNGKTRHEQQHSFSK